MPGRDAVDWCRQWLQTPWYTRAVLGMLMGFALALECWVLG